jgi:hypothetical protein
MKYVPIYLMNKRRNSVEEMACVEDLAQPWAQILRITRILHVKFKIVMPEG